MAADRNLTPWSRRVPLTSVAHQPAELDLAADETERTRIARFLDLKGLDVLSARVTVAPWHDGVEVRGDWRASVRQMCGVTAEEFPSDLADSFTVQAVPAGSPLAAAPDPDDEIEITLDTADPPDVLEENAVDVAALVVEHLALALDPFPRKPGAAFEQPAEEGPPSPFAALAALKPSGEG